METGIIIRTKNEERWIGKCEDGERADYWIKQGYVIVRDNDLVVRHSHNLSLSGWIKQWNCWFSLGKPQEFSREKLKKFRKNFTE